MKGLKQFGVLFAVVSLALTLGGCGVSKEEHQKTVAELNGVKAELEKKEADLNRVRFDLDKRTIELKQAKLETRETAEALTKARNELQTALKRHQREVKTIQAPLVGVGREAAFLRQKVDELTQGLLRRGEELGLFKDANETLRGQVGELTEEKTRLQGLLEDRKAKISELERRLRGFQDGTKN